ncbi:MAG: hypothetical protein ACSHX3_07805 [Litorimonas sp.]
MTKETFAKSASKNLKPAIEFDPAEYVQYLDGMDLTDQEAKEILSVLWVMMVQFVDLGFDVDFQPRRASQIAIPSASITDSKADKTQQTPDTGENRP